MQDFGDIYIKIYDGILRTLTGVWHVPDFKRNLISLGKLDSSGCIIFVENESGRILRGA